ncbi:MAG: hypothetical protein J6U54_08270 [Clostridiales bacterium]|nr:hypothetical protein [Clostridiales bacterium]
MKMKKVLSVMLALSMVAGIAACSKDSDRNDDSNDSSKTEREEDEDDEDIDETEDNDEDSSVADETESQETEPTEIQTVVSDKFVDFDDMSFYVNGKKYTLGVTTLQQMIDDGVPFQDVSDKDDILEGQMSYFSPYVIDLADYYSANVYVSNYSDEESKIADLTITGISFNYRSDLSQDLLSFDYPIPFKEEDLIACAGDADKTDSFDNTDILTYEKSSEIYYGTSYFKYTFTDGIFSGISMSYMP